jgi:Domain of unknown function (DUF1841)
MSENFNPYLHSAILEVVENQLTGNDPPETRLTFERLLREGHSEEDVKKLIGAVIAAEMFFVMKQGKPFDHARFVAALDRLPEIPE